MRLDGRVSIVTGGAGHIGRVLAAALAELGSSVVIVDLEPEACREAASSIAESYGVAAIPLVADLEREDHVLRISERTIERFGRIDALVNCAAFVGTSDLAGWAVPLHEQQADTWRRALEVNLTAAFVLTRACAPHLAASGAGSIVNIASIHGIGGPVHDLYEGTSMGNPAAYAASKGGLLQLTRWFATTLAPKVRVNAISPGGVWRSQPESFVERYKARTPLKRMAVEEDFKGAVAYLVSDLSAYVTGHNLVIDGGWTAW